MSTESNRKWTRVDKRRDSAIALLDSWVNGNRSYVLSQVRERRLLAAIAYVGFEERAHSPTQIAAYQICEAIHRER